MKYYKIKTKQDFKFVSFLFRAKNTKFYETKKLNVKALKELNKSPQRNDYIIEADGKKIGWFNIRQSIDKKDGIFGIIIDKKFQDKGYGSRAMDKILKEAKKLGIRRLKSQVFEENSKAIHIYKKFGFLAVAKEIVMIKNI